MNADDTRDRAVEHWLQQPLKSGASAELAPDCLDAETFAAWADGGLQRAALEMAEAHVAGCARCQAMAAVMMQTTPVLPVTTPWWRRSLRSIWLVPITAGVAAVALWAIVPNPPRPAHAPQASVSARAESRAPTANAVAPAPAPKAPPPSANRATQAAKAQPPVASAAASTALADRLEARADEATTEKRAPTPLPMAAGAAPPPGPRQATAAAPPPPPAATAAGPARARDALFLRKQEAVVREVASPDPRVRWRLGSGGTIDRTEDGGVTWTRLSTGVIEDLVAGVSPAQSMCWVVGRNGTVLRSTDGRSWARVNIPESADLVGVEAVDAFGAVVTTADGRRFSTTSGGQTWVRAPLQDF